MACCGGKNNFNLGVMMADNNQVQSPDQGAKIKLEYIGKSAGTIQYTGNVTGRSYNAGLNSLYNVIDVEPEDLPGLLNLGVFKQLNIPVIEPVVELDQVQVDQPVIEPLVEFDQIDLAGTKVTTKKKNA